MKLKYITDRSFKTNGLNKLVLISCLYYFYQGRIQFWIDIPFHSNIETSSIDIMIQFVSALPLAPFNWFNWVPVAEKLLIFSTSLSFLIPATRANEGLKRRACCTKKLIIKKKKKEKFWKNFAVDWGEEGFESLTTWNFAPLVLIYDPQGGSIDNNRL